MRVRSRLPVATVLPALCVLLPACGGAPKPDREQIASVVNTFTRAMVERDADTACPLETPAMRAGDGCTNVVAEGDVASAFRGRRIRRITIRGRSATVTFHPSRAPIILRKTDDGWLIDAA